MLYQLISSVNRGDVVISPTPIGVIKSENFSGDLSAYTITNGGGNIALNAGKLQLSGGDGIFDSYIQYSESTNPFRIHMLENWTQSVNFTTPTISASTYGMSVGIRSTNGFTQLDNMVRLSMDTGSPLGSFYFYTAQNHASNPNQDIQSSYTLLSATNYIYEVTRNKNQITATLKSAGGTILRTVTKTYNITTQSGVWSHNVGRFCIWNHGGVININSWTISSGSNRFIDLLAAGDSNMHGLYAASNTNRYVEQAATTKGYSFEIAAGIDQGCADVLSYIDQLVYMQPKKVYLNCVSNDISNGIAAATYKANYDSIRANLLAGIPGVQIINGVPIARSQPYNTLWTSHLTTQYPGDNIVNLYQDTKNAGNDALQASLGIGDLIHLNPAGNNTCAPILTAQI